MNNKQRVKYLKGLGFLRYSKSEPLRLIVFRSYVKDRDFVSFIGKINPFRRMKRLFAFFLGLLVLLCPVSVHADELYSSLQEIETTEEVKIVEVPETNPMTEEEIDELLGKDPYLGQTSWLSAKIEKKK